MVLPRLLPPQEAQTGHRKPQQKRRKRQSLAVRKKKLLLPFNPIDDPKRRMELANDFARHGADDYGDRV